MSRILLSGLLCCQPILDQALEARQQGHKIQAIGLYRQAITQMKKAGQSPQLAEQAVDDIYASMGYTPAARAWLRHQTHFQFRPQDYVAPEWIQSTHFAQSWPAGPAQRTALIPVSTMPVMLNWHTGIGPILWGQGRCYVWQGTQWQLQQTCPEDQVRHQGKLLQIETTSYGLPGASFRDDRDVLLINQQQRIDINPSLSGAFNHFVGLGPKGEVFLNHGMSKDLLNWRPYPPEIQVLRSMAPSGSGWLLGGINGLWQADAHLKTLKPLGFGNTAIDKILPIQGSADYLVWTQQNELYRGRGKRWNRWMPAEALDWVHHVEGQIYCGKDNVFYRWQGQRWEHQTLPFEIRNLVGNLWASTDQGPRFSGDQGRSWQLSTRGLQAEVKQSLSDSQEKLWAQTEDGWFQLQNQQWQTVLGQSTTYYGPQNPTDLWQASDGSWLWLAGDSQAWLNQSGIPQRFSMPDLSPPGLWPSILGLYPGLWLASHQGLWHYQAGRWQAAGLNDQLINGLYQLSPELWLATGHNGLFVSHDQGKHWSPKGLQGREAGPLQVLGQRWVVALEGNLFVTDNQGQNWRPAQWRPQPIQKFWATAQGLWAQTPEDLRYSEDGGLHWRVALRHPIADLKQTGTETWVVLPLEAGKNLVLLQSTDQGQHWTHYLVEMPIGAGKSRFLAGPNLLGTPAGLLKILN